MKNKSTLLFSSTALIGSLLINLFLFVERHFNYGQMENYEKERALLVEERVLINNLIPKLKSNISKSELERILIELKPEGKIELLSDHVSWRFFHFCFTDDDKISSVTYGS